MNLLLLTMLVTSFVAGRPVPVSCDTIPGGHAGRYDIPRDVIVLSPLACVGFTARTGSRAQAVAVYSLVHEAEHAAGILDEHQADCAAFAAFPTVVKRAGLSRLLVRWAQGIHDSFPAPYSGACTT